MMKRRYSVWVGGGEVNDYLLSRREAQRLADYWRDEGYDDVFIERYSRRAHNKMIKEFVAGLDKD